jgi:hypothetical protein
MMGWATAMLVISIDAASQGVCFGEAFPGGARGR